MKKIFKAAMTMAAASGLMLGTSVSAHADTVTDYGSYSSVDQATATGDAEADVFYTDSSGTQQLSTKTSSTYATGYFVNAGSGYTLNAWLERSTDGGATWHTVSGVHTLTNGNENDAGTYPYYDGPGYLARACFQFTSWSGAAVHCSAGI